MPAVSTSAAGDTEILPAVPGRKWVVTGLALAAASPVNVAFKGVKGGVATYLDGPLPVASSYALRRDDAGHFETDYGASLVLELSSGVLVGGHVAARQSS